MNQSEASPGHPRDDPETAEEELLWSLKSAMQTLKLKLHLDQGNSEPKLFTTQD
jgi:hypothetical protein